MNRIKKFNGIKAVIFDLDGTLIDSSEGLYESFRIACKEIQVAIPSKDKFFSAIGPPIGDVFDDVFPNHEHQKEKFVSAFRYDYDNFSFNKFKENGNLLKLFTELIKKGCYLAIVTNKPSLPTEKILNQINILNIFHEVFCRDTLNATWNKEKNLAYCIKKMCTDYNLQIENFIYVGDTAEDLEASRNNSIAFIGVIGNFFEWPLNFNQSMPLITDLVLILNHLEFKT